MVVSFRNEKREKKKEKRKKRRIGGDADDPGAERDEDKRGDFSRQAPRPKSRS